MIQRVGGKREKTNQRRRKPKAVNKQAHIEEKKEVVKPTKTKVKPKAKQTKAAVSEKKEKTKSFTIRKRED